MYIYFTSYLINLKLNYTFRLLTLRSYDFGFLKKKLQNRPLNFAVVAVFFLENQNHNFMESWGAKTAIKPKFKQLNRFKI